MNELVWLFRIVVATFEQALDHVEPPYIEKTWHCLCVCSSLSPPSVGGCPRRVKAELLVSCSRYYYLDCGASKPVASSPWCNFWNYHFVFIFQSQVHHEQWKSDALQSPLAILVYNKSFNYNTLNKWCYVFVATSKDNQRKKTVARKSSCCSKTTKSKLV